MSALTRVLIANRGEIAVRCIHACKQLSITSIAIFTSADAGSLHVRLADSSILLEGEGPRAYTNVDAILEICQKYSVQAIFPGYGFLSENADFARQVHEAGMVFIGPDSEAIHNMGLKHVARDLAVAAGVPVIQGSSLLESADQALGLARKIGFPVILKASGGGGGMGQQVCQSEDEIPAAFAHVESRSRELFGNTGVFMERYYPSSHHIEVQVFGNGSEVIHFGERECSIQRRRQKVIEECPSPYLVDKPDLRERLTSCALTLSKSIKYRSAGTVEFLVDDETGDFFFLEMNTRLQVEHGVTELCYGVDLVNLMLRQAEYQLAGKDGIPSSELLGIQKTLEGSAIEARVCSENPADSFLPGLGHVQSVAWPDKHARVDTWVQLGTFVSPYFDSLVAKVIIHRPTRTESIAMMQEALGATQIGGLVTNLTFLESIISSAAFASGRTLTTFLDSQFTFQPSGIQVINPGAFTTIQQARPRTRKGYGIPASGPMDDLSASIANLLVGNAINTECLEITANGPELRLHSACIVAIAGSPFAVKLNGEPIEMWSRIVVKPKEILKIGASATPGGRCYLAIKGGLPGVPEWLGSKSTTPSLALGGLQGRRLQPGDFFEVEHFESSDLPNSYRLPEQLIPPTDVKTIYVTHGPHDSDDLITASGRDTIYSTEWEVDYNCNRTGIRLIGPHIEWARSHGEEGGSHPSNVVDYPYPSPGGVNWTGDSPVIFPQDAPGLGGFVCSSTVVSADLYKLGKLKPGDKMRLTPIAYKSARELAGKKAKFLQIIAGHVSNNSLGVDRPLSLLNVEEKVSDTDAILQVIPSSNGGPTLTLRQGGDRFIIINVDIPSKKVGLDTSVASNNLARAIQSANTPGTYVHININSVMVEYEPEKIAQSDVVLLIKDAHQRSSSVDEPLVARRFILPIVFDHPSINEAALRYTTMQRDKAVYVPDNVTYVQENNGLASRDDVFSILRKTRFLVITVGFMTGLPLLWPLDPLARLTSQKYNPTRISTPPGTVGLGGGLFCVYPADQPGGYMMLARSIPVWDIYALRPGFREAKPWLCEPFDLIEFQEVSLDEYTDILRRFEAGTYEIQIEETKFNVRDELAKEHEAGNLPNVVEFRKKQIEAEEQMRLREEKLLAEWQADRENALPNIPLGSGDQPGIKVASPQVGKVWKVLAKPGDIIEKEKPLVVLEAMKMEIPVAADESHDGLVVKELLVQEGTLVSPGTPLVLLDKAD
ncbi:AHS2-domain-containing protein [Hypoxylon trugodes]|uniref:AHS2-domain-containing protein n=1 Tax=Hypoxylon trugodes TaxID=326681 RepID=UPI002196F744|nr:AHS2-domain-containing protein [Hypoxylon trugodes]KAI1385920.1 AHS2-domain-containing protein [Hypoxylon trugodes]